MKAFEEAARAATRSSILGVLGFGLALAMGAILAAEDAFLSVGHGLEMILFTGGLAGGLAFTVLAIRASRIARACQRRLEELEQQDRSGGRRHSAKRRL